MLSVANPRLSSTTHSTVHIQQTQYMKIQKSAHPLQIADVQSIVHTHSQRSLSIRRHHVRVKTLDVINIRGVIVSVSAVGAFGG